MSTQAIPVRAMLQSRRPKHDASHEVAVVAVKGYRTLVREDVGADVAALCNSLADAVNALGRTVFGLAAVTFTIAADMCKRWKDKCRRVE